jgi:hypothetical protein
MSARLLVPAAVSAALLQGCAYHRLTVERPNPYGDYQRVDTNAFVWGAIEHTAVASKCETSLLSEIRVVTSLPQALATALTAGLWMPATVEYKCAKRPASTGSTAE